MKKVEGIAKVLCAYFRQQDKTNYVTNKYQNTKLLKRKYYHLSLEERYTKSNNYQGGST